ncbi:hypothetical protein [Brucella sp. NBRC 12950]|uniref:hypothetical protein n=1 Tax=Brucella sp. NBRC 12950 TaxID=2994518 RepID=UPI0024A0B0FC|nr:hypothetical protein [Brucella sp. NBRC 12950]GLU29938.1 hypothetical protein Brsp01_51710 [Brucella sp. NBRC 12950]
MRSPKREGFYPDRDVDCQDAVSQSIADLIEQATLSSTSEADAAAAISDTAIPGIRDLIDHAVAAGWSAEETANAIKVVSDGMYVGHTSKEPDE